MVSCRYEDYVHDKNGNLLRVERPANADDASPAQSDVHVIASGTNRLTSVVHAAGTRSFTHDARGNLTADTRPAGAGVTLAYDGHARLASYARAGAETQAMLYNGFDERVGLTTMLGGSAVEERRFAYDAGHRIVGEYGATTADLRAEYIWLLPEVGDGTAFGGDDGLGGYMPLAVAIPDGATSKLHWTQGNHLGTPVVTTDSSGAVVTPTGYARIGFPGQVEQHADLYYNYYRDYDPTLGRYVQADPIGLGGDVNPYAYAAANPLVGIDPLGLTNINLHNPVDDPAWFIGALSQPDRPGICSVFAHGSDSHILVNHPGKANDMRYWQGEGFTKGGVEFRSLDEFTRILEARCKKDEIIVLWSCNTGMRQDGFASQLAKTMRRRVRAPTTYVWAYGGQLSPHPSHADPFHNPGRKTSEGEGWQDFGPDGKQLGRPYP
ncbi:RHS repeat-associated core domain-containing protein [Sphingopyxis microcysteis]|uniref:RHS repeat-associated core domain-containing protein n=1 Tax=Sphingopyxis microcysteis TaxID=2484145 RepID=UPI00144602D5|nr:RHS repeat-associated core domain-containing protein [Sphingopyxis microcysteis]